jgi:hypothetical protein
MLRIGTVVLNVKDLSWLTIVDSGSVRPADLGLRCSS